MAGKSKGRPRKSVVADAEQPTGKSKVAGKDDDQAGDLKNGNVRIVEEKLVVEKKQ
jgi:hypothetical protein